MNVMINYPGVDALFLIGLSQRLVWWIWGFASIESSNMNDDRYQPLLHPGVIQYGDILSTSGYLLLSLLSFHKLRAVSRQCGVTDSLTKTQQQSHPERQIRYSRKTHQASLSVCPIYTNHFQHHENHQFAIFFWQKSN